MRSVLALLTALAALACGTGSEPGAGAPDTAAPSAEATPPTPEPPPPLADFAMNLLAVDDVSLGALRAAFGEPRRVEREPVENRHVPGQTDTILTVSYDGALLRLYQVSGGRTLPEHAEIGDPRFLRWPRPTIGTPADSLVVWWGEPLRREGGTLVYEDGGPVSTPIYFHTRDGRITTIEREYYLD